MFELDLILVRNLLFTATLLVIFVYDVRYMVIPYRITLLSTVLAIFINLYFKVIPISSLVIGACVISGLFYFQYYISKAKSIGRGDIYLGVLIGSMLGFQQGILAVLLGYVIGAFVSLYLVYFKHAHARTKVPLGAFLSVSTIVFLFFGDSILYWYLGLFV